MSCAANCTQCVLRRSSYMPACVVSEAAKPSYAPSTSARRAPSLRSAAVGAKRSACAMMAARVMHDPAVGRPGWAGDQRAAVPGCQRVGPKELAAGRAPNAGLVSTRILG